MRVFLLPEPAGMPLTDWQGRSRRSAARRTTGAGRRRRATAGKTHAVLAGRKVEGHRTVSVHWGAHEDTSWRFSVVDAAQAAPSNPAIDHNRPMMHLTTAVGKVNPTNKNKIVSFE